MEQTENGEAGCYGEGCAEIYDEIYGTAAPNLLATLCDLAGDGRVLELGVGTGRVALPLAARGVNICVMEASRAMIAKLREKPGGSNLTVIEGNFANIQLHGSFSLIFTLVSTFFLLSSRREQRQCFQAVARRLSAQGIFLIEAFKPVGAKVVTRVGPDGSREEIHTVEQLLETRVGTLRYRSELCYAEPQALDEMAQEAGLRLKQRWRNWKHQPCLDDDGSMHISLYERP
jgi:SAM-dependent methyltransferase